MIDPQITEICRRVRVSEYLQRHGSELLSFGNKKKCRCPLPSHRDDDTPSFYIYQADDGAEVFKCFGCSVAGNIITLIHLMEGKKKGEVVNGLAKATGVELGRFDPSIAMLEPALEDVTQCFCNEDKMAMKISTICLEFLKAHGGSEDAVNKVGRIHQMLDDFTMHGDTEAMREKWGVSSLRDIMRVVLDVASTYKDKGDRR